MQSQICDSVRDYLIELDEAVSSLAGMDRQQDTPQMHNLESQRMNAVLHYVPRMMAEPATTRDQLLFKIRGLAAEYTECAVRASKVRIGHQLQGMTLLSRAVRLDKTELEEFLQTAETVQLLGLVVHFSLVEFRTHLRRGGACLEELEGVFPPLPSSVAPPSGWVRYEVFRRWLTLHETVVAEACVAGIGLARRLQSLPTNAPEWSGLHLVDADGADSAQREWRDWTPPRHLRGGVAAKRIVVTDHHTLGLGLRACRFFDMLETQVLLNLMPLMRIRADLLLPVMARLSASTLVEWSCHERRPVLYNVAAKARAQPPGARAAQCARLARGIRLARVAAALSASQRGQRAAVGARARPGARRGGERARRGGGICARPVSSRLYHSLWHVALAVARRRPGAQRGGVGALLRQPGHECRRARGARRAKCLTNHGREQNFADASLRRRVPPAAPARQGGPSAAQCARAHRGAHVPQGLPHSINGCARRPRPARLHRQSTAANGKQPQLVEGVQVARCVGAGQGVGSTDDLDLAVDKLLNSNFE